MFCPECGKTLLENTTVCPTCGATVPNIPPEEGTGAAGPAATPSYSAPPPAYTPPPPAGSAGQEAQAVAYGGSSVSAAIDITKTMKTYFIISAVTNGLLALIWLACTLLLGVTTMGCGCLMIVVPILNIVALVLDIMAFSKLGAAPSAGNYNFIRIATILDMVTVITCNIIALIMGILNIQSLGRNEVKQYFNAK